MNPFGRRPNSDKPSAPPENKSGWRFWENGKLAGGIDAMTATLKKNPPSNLGNLSVTPKGGSWWGIPGKMGLTALFAKLARAPTVNPPGGRSNSDNSSAPPESKSGWRFWENRLPVTFGLAGKAVTAAPQKNPSSNPDNRQPDLDIPSGPTEGHPGWTSWVKELPAKIGLTSSGNTVAGAAIASPPGKSVISPNDERPKPVIPSGSTEGQPGWTSWVKELPVKIGLTTSGNAAAGPAIASPPGKSVISKTDHGRPNSDIPPEPPEGQSAWKTMEKGLPAALSVAAAGVAVAGAPLIISGVGFGAGGIAAGSAAASIMSSAATAGVGMGAVSALQSAGAAGLAAGTKILIGASAGAAAAKIAGVALDKGNKQGGNPSGGDGKGVNLGGNVAGESSRDKDLGENGTERKNSWYSGWGKYFRSKI